MKNINIVKALFFIITISFVTSCETVVTDSITLTGEAPKLIIEGGIERNIKFPLQEQVITLTTTVGFLEDVEPEFVSNASVVISVNDDDYEFIYDDNGRYVNADIPTLVDEIYTLTVEWQNEVYVGQDRLLSVPTFDRLYSEFEAETQISDEGHFLKFDCLDPVDEVNYYYYRVFRNGEFFIVADPGNDLTLVESDEFFNGQLRKGVKPNEEVIFAIGDTGTAQQMGITKEYHDFLSTLFVQTGNAGFSLVGNPPPASIRGNIRNETTPSNRALGFFYAASVEQETITIN